MTTCDNTEFKGEHMELRIASVFIVLILSALGVFFPLVGSMHSVFRLPKILLFAVRFFGSGVIVATAFIHLLGEADEYLKSECLSGGWKAYPWAAAFCLMGAWTMFTIEFGVSEYVKHRGLVKSDGCSGGARLMLDENHANHVELDDHSHIHAEPKKGPETEEDTIEPASCCSDVQGSTYKKLVSIFILEFGIVFHSVFVGLSLAIAQNQFKTLLVAICFHQFFEGVGLGARFAAAVWPRAQNWVPWAMALAFSLTTPLGIAAGLGVRHSYSENSKGSLIVVGVFNSFCSGILIYNGLVDLMGQDFIHGDFLQECPWKKALFAYVMLTLGCFAMALIGKWA